ncbi:MAG: alpha-glucosidase [Candidatus Thorarchaeota archaeon]|nr:alpha-glucosidase [Candidatus Thorarchaeota archaeon]
MSIFSVHEIPWWKKTTVYHIYPRSYKDSSGNGIGDIPGIISKLDYLKDFGIETIWLSPIFSSPQADHGYDVSGYRSIAPEYGSIRDCELLIREIHTREMYIVFDLVLNHTSDQHPWFQESQSSRDNPKRDWYIWHDGQKPMGKKPPNNWKSMLGGSGWHYRDLTDQWYWAQFLPFQPDLNYRNPDVKKEMFDTIRFWLDKGIDGFRLDIINTIFEDEQFRNNPFTWKFFPSDADDSSFFQKKIHTINHPDNFIFVKELRSVLDEYDAPERFLVGEISASVEVLKKYCGDAINKTRTNGLHLTFQFQSLNVPLMAKPIHELICLYEQHLSEPYIPTWVFSNHDQMRRISKLGNDLNKAKLNATLQLTARGVPFIYYGEEVGMSNHRLPLKTAEDPIGQRFSRLPKFLVNLLTRKGSISLNRDDCRTPMQWDPSLNAGFCSEELEPWLPLSLGHHELNVSSEEDNPDSLLNCYKALLRLRKKMPALHSGSISFLNQSLSTQSLLSYQRIHDEQVAQIWLNFSKKPLEIGRIEVSSKLLFSTIVDADSLKDSKLHLEPYQGVVLGLSA